MTTISDFGPVEDEYKVRFISQAQSYELVNLYHLARTALSGTDKSDTPHNRMIWASGELARSHYKISSIGAYKDLCGLLGR